MAHVLLEFDAPVKTSVVMTYIGRPKTLAYCLDNLDHQADEVILIDGNKEGKSESDSVRIGLEKATGDVILFTNVDCYVPPDWVQRHLVWHKLGFDLVSGNRVNINPISSSWNAYHQGKVQFVQGPGLGYTGSNASISRMALTKTGFTPPGPRGWDAWLGSEAVRQHLRMVIDPGITVKHDHEFRNTAHSMLYGRWSAAQSSATVKATAKAGIDPHFRSTIAELVCINSVKVWKQYPESRQVSLPKFVFNRVLFKAGQLIGYMVPVSWVKRYVWKQFRFSFGNLFSVPVGTFLLWFFTTYGHIWYVYSSLLSLVVTTVMNFWVQVALKVIRMEKGEPEK